MTCPDIEGRLEEHSLGDERRLAGQEPMLQRDCPHLDQTSAVSCQSDIPPRRPKCKSALAERSSDRSLKVTGSLAAPNTV